MWNKNIITVRQVGTKVDLIVRNAAYNYRAMIDTNNQLSQSAVGNVNQISKIRNILLRQSQGRANEVVHDVTQFSAVDLEKMVLNDSTLMALIDPNAHFVSVSLYFH